MVDRSVVRSVVRPVIGDKAWRSLRAAQGKRRRGGPEAELERRSRAGDLTWLGRHFKTDKAGFHRYTQHYQTHFAPLRDKQVVLLEIGIGGYSRAGAGGASLRMWKHYFRRGRIYGLDIEDKSFVDEERIRSFQGSQADAELLQRIVAEVGRPDIVIDDGSHRPEHILTTFEVLFPLLADDGIYVVEDTQTSYWPEWGGAEDPEDRETSMAMLKRLCDGLNHVEFVTEGYEPTYTDLHVVAAHFYHNLVFIQKGLNTEKTHKEGILRARYAARAAGVTEDPPSRGTPP